MQTLFIAIPTILLGAILANYNLVIPLQILVIILSIAWQHERLKNIN